MYKPKYLLMLTGEYFPSDSLICTGKQMEQIVNWLVEKIPGCSWYVADVDAYSPVPTNRGINTYELQKLGGTDELITLCTEIEQFLRGVFIAANSELRSTVAAGTEDERFRDLDMEDVAVEIRSFDTTYFEVYTESKELFDFLKRRFQVKDKDVLINGKTAI